MQNTTKTGMKRKLEIVDSKVNNKGNEKIKPPLKAELIIQLKELQENFDALEAINIRNLETIKSLQDRITVMEKAAQSVKLKCNECNFVATNDEELSVHINKNHSLSEEGRLDEELDLSVGPRYCNKCEHEAEDGYQLDAHIWTEHDEENVEVFTCKYCDKDFTSLKDVMIHKKAMHIEKVSSCWHFSNGLCTYGDERCWFSHIESQSSLDKRQLECIICEKVFTKRADVMKHKKSEHPKSVQICKLIKRSLQ